MSAPESTSKKLDRKVATFRAAAASYIKHGGSTRYLPRITAYFGDALIAEITPFDVKQMAKALYPNQGNATLNRCALTPARAVLIHAYERGWCNLMRLTRLKQPPPRRKTPASTAWLQIFVRQCDIDGLPHLGALVIFMHHTGARISEAVRLRWPEVNLDVRKVILLRTKTSTHSTRDLTDELVRRIRALSCAREDRVFTYTSRYSVNERIKAVCQRAGIPYKSPHLCGRHSFATNSLALGSSIKEAMEAGDWKSSAVFLETYVHTRNAGRRVADRFNSVEFDDTL